MSVMEGRNIDHIEEKFKNVYWSTLVANWKVWPALQVRFFLVVQGPACVSTKKTCSPADQLSVHAFAISSTVQHDLWHCMEWLPFVGELQV